MVPCRTTKTDCRFEDIADIAGVETGYPSASARGGLGLDDTASNGEENERFEELVRLARLNVAHVWYLIHLGVTDTLTTTGKRWARGETYIYPSAGVLNAILTKWINREISPFRCNFPKSIYKSRGPMKNQSGA